MPKIKDLCVVVGEYEKDGQTKKRWQTIGALMETKDGGKFVLLDPLVNLAAVPRDDGKDRVMVSLFEPKENRPASSGTDKPVYGDDRYKAAQQMQAPSNNSFDDDSTIPF